MFSNEQTLNIYVCIKMFRISLTFKKVYKIIEVLFRSD